MYDAGLTDDTGESADYLALGSRRWELAEADYRARREQEREEERELKRIENGDDVYSLPEPPSPAAKRIYPRRKAKWSTDKLYLPQLLVDGPYPSAPDGELLKTPDEWCKNHKGEDVLVRGRPWQWWERAFDLLIPHATQLAKKVYWYVWEECESAGIFRVALMLNSEREHRVPETSFRVTTHHVTYILDNRLFDLPENKTLWKCREEAKTRMREHSWFLRNSFDPPYSTHRVDLEKEQKQREDETGIRLWQHKAFKRSIYQRRYSKPSFLGLGLEHREKMWCDAAEYVQDKNGETGFERIDDRDEILDGNGRGTEQERELLALAAFTHGENNKAIAEETGLHVRQVQRMKKELTTRIDKPNGLNGMHCRSKKLISAD